MYIEYGFPLSRHSSSHASPAHVHIQIIYIWSLFMFLFESLILTLMLEVGQIKDLEEQTADICSVDTCKESTRALYYMQLHIHMRMLRA